MKKHLKLKCFLSFAFRLDRIIPSFNSQSHSHFPVLFADADFCCGMDTPDKAKNISGWAPGRAQNRGA